METDARFEDGYYDSPKALAKKLNGDKPGRVRFSYEPVTQKFVANVKSETTSHCTVIYPTYSGSASERQEPQSLIVDSFDVCTRLLHRRFEARFRIAIRLFEYRRTTHRRRQDCTAATNSADNRKPRGDGDDPFRPRPVHSPAKSRIWQRRNRIRDDRGRPVPFERGKVTVTLHFRRCSSGLFR